MGIGVESDRLKGVNVDLAVLHVGLLDRCPHNLSDHAQPGFIALILNKLTLNRNGKLMDDRGVHQLRLHKRQAGLFKFLRLFASADHAEPIRFHDVLCIGEMDDKALPSLDILNSSMRLRQVKRYHIPVEHGAPGSVHNIHASVLVEGGNEKYGHRKNGFRGLDLLLHGLIPPVSFAVVLSQGSWYHGAFQLSSIKVLDKLCDRGNENRP